MDANSTISPPVILDVPELRVACIPLKVPVQEIQQHMGPALKELSDVLQAQGIKPAGPWFTYHFSRPREVFDMQVCFPVFQDVEPTGRVVNATRRAAKVVRTVHSGGYDKLVAAWLALESWTKSERYQTSADLWEVYLTGPRDDADAAHWQTELNWPLIATPAQEQTA